MDFFGSLKAFDEEYRRLRSERDTGIQKCEASRQKLTTEKEQILKEGMDKLTSMEASDKASAKKNLNTGIKQIRDMRLEQIAEIELKYSDRREYLTEQKAEEEKKDAYRRGVDVERQRIEKRIVINQVSSKLTDARFELRVRQHELDKAKENPDKPMMIRLAENRVAEQTQAVASLEAEMQALESAQNEISEESAILNSTLESIKRKIDSIDAKEKAAKDEIESACKTAEEELNARAAEVFKEIADTADEQRQKLKAQQTDADPDDCYASLRAVYADKLNVLSSQIADCERSIKELSCGDAVNKLLDKAVGELSALIDPDMCCILGEKDLTKVKELPHTVTLGQTADDWRSLPVVNELEKHGMDLGRVGSGTGFGTDLFSVTGHVVIYAADKTANDARLNEIIAAWILKYYESIPLGNLKVEFFEYTKNIMFDSFGAAFKKNADLFKMRTGQKGAREMIDSLQTACNTMRSTFSPDVQNVRDLYQLDRDNAVLHLVVIRNGLFDFLRIGYDYYQMFLNMLGESGNQVGIRFLIVDDRVSAGESWQKEESVEFDAMEEQLLSLTYENGHILFDDKELVPPAIPAGTDFTRFIFGQCGKMDDTVDKVHNSLLSYEEIGFGSDYDGENTHDFVTLNIPIGKYGQYIFNAKLMVKEENRIINQGFIVMGGSGSGKSSFMHSIILNGAMKYSPEDLQFWLLDFKDGSSTGVYLNANIPHIRLLSMKNKQSDALVLLQQIIGEMETRANIFKSAARRMGSGVALEDLVDYNRFVDAHPEEGAHLPRIVIMIDEGQEMYKEDPMSGSSDVQSISSLITDIAIKGRAYGIFTVIIVQNFNVHKTNLLKDAYVKHVRGRVCFGINSDLVRESGFGEKYLELRDEIQHLKMGVAMCQNHVDLDVQKVKIAYADPKKFNTYFDRIREKYSSFRAETRVLGDTSPLLPDKRIAGSDRSYADAVMNPRKTGSDFSFVIGENATTLNAFECRFKESDKGGMFAVGSDAVLMSSVSISVMLGALNVPDSRVFVCNGSGRGDILNTVLGRISGKSNICIYKPANVHLMLASLYRIYLKRKEAEENYSESDNYPIYVVINNAPSLTKIKDNNDFKRQNAAEYQAVSAADDPGRISDGEEDDKAFYETYLIGKRPDMIITELIQNGNALNIFLNISMSDFSSRIMKDCWEKMSNMIAFNDYNMENNPSRMNMSVRGLLSSIRREDDGNGLGNADSDADTEGGVSETMAISISGGGINKFRPVIWTEDKLDLI